MSRAPGSFFSSRGSVIQANNDYALDVEIDDRLVELLLAAGDLRLTVLLGVLDNLLEGELAVLEVLAHA